MKPDNKNRTTDENGAVTRAKERVNKRRNRNRVKNSYGGPKDTIENIVQQKEGSSVQEEVSAHIRG